MRGKASVSRHARHVCLSNIAILRAMCQRNHWPKHKNPCKQGASKLHDEALFKDYSYTQIKRADQQLAWRRRRSNFRGKLTYISSRIRSIGVFRHLESEYHSEFTSPQTRHSVTQCTWALVHAADFQLTTLVKLHSANTATSERIVSVRWAPS